MTQRPVWKVIVYGVVTLGIYDLYWLYKTRLELVARGFNVPRVRWLVAPIALLIAIGLFQFVIRFITVQSDASSMADLLTKILNIISILGGIAAILAAIIIPFVWFYKYSLAVASVTSNTMSLGSAYGLYILLSLFGIIFVWPGIIQDAYNRIGQTARPMPQAPLANPTI